MSKYIFILVLCFPLLCQAQPQPVKVLFDVSTKEKAAHENAVRHVQMMVEAYPTSRFEIVVYGGALPMVLKNQSTVAEAVEKLTALEAVTINVCRESLVRNNIAETELLPGVKMVPDGILELVQRQSEGWGYIKEVN